MRILHLELRRPQPFLGQIEDDILAAGFRAHCRCVQPSSCYKSSSFSHLAPTFLKLFASQVYAGTHRSEQLINDSRSKSFMSLNIMAQKKGKLILKCTTCRWKLDHNPVHKKRWTLKL
jgi:hypothetical protein